MKKTITLLALAFGCISINAQQITADFEGLGLAPNSAYSNTNSVSWQTSNAVFPYLWETQFGGFWSGGFSYTNKYDSATAGSGNLYGVKPLYGVNTSSTYVVAQDKGTIKLKSPNNLLDGFYVTNTTYAFKSMKLGDQFAKKFGGVSGNDPDYFALTVKGYLNGALKTDTVAFYLADFRFANNTQDYIVNTWQYVSTSALGQVDSVKFFLSSSDVSGGFMNTPAFFGMDNFTTSSVLGVTENTFSNGITLYPNPVASVLNLRSQNPATGNLFVKITNVAGKEVYSGEFNGSGSVNLQELEKGIYFAEITDGENKAVKKIIKE